VSGRSGFIGVANLAGLVPGMGTPTADLNTTFALALVSYAMAHVVGIKAQGLRGYLAHYAEPTWVLLPFHLIAEATRTVALAVRLFGNMLSGDMVAVIILGIAGLLVPVPFDLLHVVIGLIQAYIFGMLTLVFIAGGWQPHQKRSGPETLVDVSISPPVSGSLPASDGAAGRSERAGVDGAPAEPRRRSSARSSSAPSPSSSS
jgi:hypothetical protein